MANTTAKFVLATIVIFILSIMYEGLKYLREKWFNEKVQAEMTKNGTLSKTDRSWQ
jgi:hypothetical protein